MSLGAESVGDDLDQHADAPVHLQHVLIKWTGGKTRQARRIVEHFPRRIGTYHEPFLGGGAVLYELLGSDIEVERIECGDTCVPLVELWQVVRDDPEGLVRRYAEMWDLLRSGGRHYYYEVRHEFNTVNDPYLFFFLLRTSRNGLVRFNRNGEFNTGYRGDNPGMAPETVESLVEGWGARLRRRDVRFAVRDYREVASEAGDLLYLDPPYSTEGRRYYDGMIDFPAFFDWLRGQRGDYLLSLNGFLGQEDRTVAVPRDLYDEHLLLDNGTNPFDRLSGRVARPVSDSLYIGRRSPARSSEQAPPGPGDPEHVPAQHEVVNKSAEIRAVLEAEPQLTGPEVVRRLAERGIKVDANFVRVIRHNLRKAKAETMAQEERKDCDRRVGSAGMAVGLLKFRIASYGIADVPQAGEVQVSLDDLIALENLIGGQVTSEHLIHAGHGLWMSRYCQLTGISPREAETLIKQSLDRLHTTSTDAATHDTEAIPSEPVIQSHPQYASFGEEREDRPPHPEDESDQAEWMGDDEELCSEEDREKMERLRNMKSRWSSRRF